MKNRGYAVGIVLFFAGLIGLWWLDYAHVPDRDAARLSEGRVLSGLWDVRPDDVRRVEIDGGPQRLAFERRPGNRWQMTAPADVAADPSIVETLAANLKMLERIRDAGTLHESPSSYGLAPPERTVRLYGPGSSKPLATLEIGSFATNRDQALTSAAPAARTGSRSSTRGCSRPSRRRPTPGARPDALCGCRTFQVQSLDVHRGDGKGLRIERQGDVWSFAAPFRTLRGRRGPGRRGVLGQICAGLRVPDGGFAADDAKRTSPPTA